MSLEIVIRAYLPARSKQAEVSSTTAASSETESELNVFLTWEAKTAIKTSSQQTIYASSAGTKWPSAWVEVARGTHDERVENPDDPDQYITVKVVDWISWRREDGKDGTEVKYTYGNAANAPGNPNF